MIIMIFIIKKIIFNENLYYIIRMVQITSADIKFVLKMFVIFKCKLNSCSIDLRLENVSIVMHANGSFLQITPLVISQYF